MKFWKLIVKVLKVWPILILNMYTKYLWPVGVIIFRSWNLHICAGVARGCGWQKIGACVNLGAYYIVGIPSAYLIAFVLHVGGMVLTEEPSRSFVCLNFHQVPCCKLFLVDVMSFNNAECLIGSMARHHLRPLGASPATNGNNTMHKLG